MTFEVITGNMDYKFNEAKLLNEFAKYIDETYSSHYSTNQFQAAEFIVDSNHGAGFFIGNIMKYAQRYGNKGTEEEARKDLMKILHYSLLAIYNHDVQIKTTNQKSSVDEYDEPNQEVIADMLEVDAMRGDFDNLELTQQEKLYMLKQRRAESLIAGRSSQLTSDDSVY
jgi:hypothetical protein